MRPLTFVHAADLHLDSPFRGFTKNVPEVARALRDATYDAFRRLVALCQECEADFLLLAGDVFDCTDRSVKAQLALHEGLSALAGKDIGTFIAYGNHDPLSGRSHPLKWPDGVHIFPSDRPETRLVKKKDGTPLCTVTGMSYEKEKEERNLAGMFRRPDPDLFAIGLLHCSVGSNPAHASYAPCAIEDLLAARMDYWALGHVHERVILHQDPVVAYPGNTQGRSFREQGERGCLVVSVERTGAVETAFHPLDVVRWVEKDIPINGFETMDHLHDSIAETTEQMSIDSDGRPVICRIILSGRGPLYPVLRQEETLTGILEHVNLGFQGRDPFIRIQELVPECRPERDLDQRRMAGDFLAEVLTTARIFREEGPDGYARLRGSTVQALMKQSPLDRIIGPIDDREMEKLLAEAEFICLDLLEQQVK